MLTNEPLELPDPGVPDVLPAGDADNRLRLSPGDARGHVESLFIKGNSPDGQRALWVKYTLLVPRHHAEQAVAELWAVAFERGRAPRANKQTFPLASARISEAPFALSLPCAELRSGQARGELGGGGPRFRWQLSFACAAQAFRPFPSARMYSGAFPRTKTLTPAPDARLSGFFEIDGERWDVGGYAAAQGHNWGRGHAHAYAWLHANALDVVAQEGGAPVRESWLELISGRVRLGPLLTPWLSCGAVCIDGALYRFDGLSSLLSRELRVDTRSYQFRLRQGDAELVGTVAAEERLIAGLRYVDPDGQSLACLNSKLATGSFTLRAHGKMWRLTSERVALELGTRAADHGIAMIA